MTSHPNRLQQLSGSKFSKQVVLNLVGWNAITVIRQTGLVVWNAVTDNLMVWYSVVWNAITVALRCMSCYFSTSANRLCLTSEKPQMRPTLFLNMLKYASCAKGCISSRTALGAEFQAEGLFTEFSSC